MAIKTYSKGVSKQITANFRSVEFDCRGTDCCVKSTLIDDKLVEYLQQIRDHFNKPLYISSAYRCEAYNTKIGGAPLSYHVKGQAADVYMTGVKPAEIAKYAESIGILGIGLYETDTDGHFVHIDTRTAKFFWYGQKEEPRDTFGGAKKIIVPAEPKDGEMKYSKETPPIVCMQTQSTCYTGTKEMEIRGVLWHSTAANNTTLKRYVQPSDDDPNKDELLELLGKNKYNNDWNHITRQAGLNCWVGTLADGSVTTIQTMPWNYRPWGCGSGKNGSCNSGWIQFEICEDDTTSKEYFMRAYKEACQITAYLCKEFNIDPFGTVEVVSMADDSTIIEVPTILCHQDSYKLGLGSDHSDIYHWFPKFGKSMETVREDVAALMGVSKPEPEKPIIYKYWVRKTWEDAASEVGAYVELDEAKAACDKAGTGYEVYNAEGVAVYPEVKEPVIETGFKVGDEVKLVEGATYITGVAIPSWVFKAKLYVRQIYTNGNIVFSTQKTGAITGVVAAHYLTPYTTTAAAPSTPAFEPYIVAVNVDILNVRAGASTKNRITTQIRRNELYTIVAENGNWGKLKSGAGWICLDYVKKV